VCADKRGNAWFRKHGRIGSLINTYQLMKEHKHLVPPRHPNVIFTNVKAKHPKKVSLPKRKRDGTLDQDLHNKAVAHNAWFDTLPKDNILSHPGCFEGYQPGDGIEPTGQEYELRKSRGIVDVGPRCGQDSVTLSGGVRKVVLANTTIPPRGQILTSYEANYFLRAALSSKGVMSFRATVYYCLAIRNILKKYITGLDAEGNLLLEDDVELLCDSACLLAQAGAAVVPASVVMLRERTETVHEWLRDGGVVKPMLYQHGVNAMLGFKCAEGCTYLPTGFGADVDWNDLGDRRRGGKWIAVQISAQSPSRPQPDVYGNEFHINAEEKDQWFGKICGFIKVVGSCARNDVDPEIEESLRLDTARGGTGQAALGYTHLLIFSQAKEDRVRLWSPVEPPSYVQPCARLNTYTVLHDQDQQEQDFKRKVLSGLKAV